MTFRAFATAIVAVAALAALAALAGCSGAADLDGASGSPTAAASASGTSVPEVSASGAVPEAADETVSVSPSESPSAAVGLIRVTDQNLIEAFEAAGYPCEGSLDGVTCRGIFIVMPADWDADLDRRRQDCADGVRLIDSHLIGDDATWYGYVDATYPWPVLEDLAEAGYEAFAVDSCPA